MSSENNEVEMAVATMWNQQSSDTDCNMCSIFYELKVRAELKVSI